MNAYSKKNQLTLGEFVVSVYDTCDARWADVVVWFAIRAHLVVLQERGPQLPFGAHTRQIRCVLDE
ncbi:hypothetical protein [Prosthecobacter sp.]|uniref:hypothetical protein n=1 Tax=Prosthecobacter sp. TaxID=1965333 RepID=UPI002ABBF9EC|nr:hypothetical protein [Prosthecobacter sp.]MDZ4401784.1 hypothetical protein [Prosthecobacter sp.]